MRGGRARRAGRFFFFFRNTGGKSLLQGLLPRVFLRYHGSDLL